MLRGFWSTVGPTFHVLWRLREKRHGGDVADGMASSGRCRAVPPVGADRQALERLLSLSSGRLGGLADGVASNYRMCKSSAAEPAHRVALAASADVSQGGHVASSDLCPARRTDPAPALGAIGRRQDYEGKRQSRLNAFNPQQPRRHPYERSKCPPEQPTRWSGMRRAHQAKGRRAPAWRPPAPCCGPPAGSPARQRG